MARGILTSRKCDRRVSRHPRQSTRIQQECNLRISGASIHVVRRASAACSIVSDAAANHDARSKATNRVVHAGVETAQPVGRLSRPGVGITGLVGSYETSFSGGEPYSQRHSWPSIDNKFIAPGADLLLKRPRPAQRAKGLLTAPQIVNANGRSLGGGFVRSRRPFFNPLQAGLNITRERITLSNQPLPARARRHIELAQPPI